jgi:hypothetical protein
VLKNKKRWFLSEPLLLALWDLARLRGLFIPHLIARYFQLLGAGGYVLYPIHLGFFIHQHPLTAPMSSDQKNKGNDENGDYDRRLFDDFIDLVNCQIYEDKRGQGYQSLD